MNRILKVFVLAAVLQTAGLNAWAAEAAKTYQVTGPIVELTDKTITVQKGDERWEIARNENTHIEGELKVGQKVTVHYRMTATRVESKEPGRPGAAEKKKSK
jgi:ribosomal protein S1